MRHPIAKKNMRITVEQNRVSWNIYNSRKAGLILMTLRIDVAHTGDYPCKHKSCIKRLIIMGNEWENNYMFLIISWKISSRWVHGLYPYLGLVLVPCALSSILSRESFLVSIFCYLLFFAVYTNQRCLLYSGLRGTVSTFWQCSQQFGKRFVVCNKGESTLKCLSVGAPLHFIFISIFNGLLA